MWTRQWWANPMPDQRLVTSAVVFEELEHIPDIARRERSLALIRGLEQLNYTVEIAEIEEVYVSHKLMPAEATGDADHLALASFYNCDMLVTWNCRHLANANKAGHIRRVNALLGLRTPMLVTPLQLLEKDHKTNRDEPLEEIWVIRRQIAKKLGHDPKKRAAHYQRKQKQLGARLYKREEPVAAGK
jgi:predicted nucleic acid-binding protein